MAAAGSAERHDRCCSQRRVTAGYYAVLELEES